MICSSSPTASTCRHARRGVRERAQQARLAQHVVGARRQRRARRAAQHELLAAPLDQVGDVRVALADRARADLARAEPVLVEERLERVEHEQRRAAVSLPLRRGADDVVWRDSVRSRTGTYSDRNLPCAEVSQSTMPRFRSLTLPSSPAPSWPPRSRCPPPRRLPGPDHVLRGRLDAARKPTRRRSSPRCSGSASKRCASSSPGPPSPLAEQRREARVRRDQPGLLRLGALRAGDRRRRSACGWPVLLTVTSPVPRWATSNQQGARTSRGPTTGTSRNS